MKVSNGGRKRRVINQDEQTSTGEIIEKELQSDEVRKLESKKKKVKKRKYSFESLGDISKENRGKVIKPLVFSSIGIIVFMLVFVTFEVHFPRAEKRNLETSGLGCLQKWEDSIDSLSNNSISSETGSDSYLAKELEYANGNENVEEFMKKMVSTVSYTPDGILEKNKYGNPMIDFKGEKQYCESLANEPGEELTLNYVDYNKIVIDSKKVQEILAKEELSTEDVDYYNKLVNVFCIYMNSIKELPIKHERYVPNIIGDGISGFTVAPEEDEELDKKLFSSSEFYNLLVDFSQVIVGDSAVTDEWKAWKSVKDTLSVGTLSDDGMTTLDAEGNPILGGDGQILVLGKEPSRLVPKYNMSKIWCGAYALTHQEKEEDNVIASLGDGTKDNPASLGTWVVTTNFADDGSQDPIRVRVVDYKVSQDALDWFETKDDRNRGYDIKSNVQYISFVVEVQNLSKRDIYVEDNSALCDELANCSPRTGTIYGLHYQEKLAPGQTTQLECWGSSTELNKKYLIWGKDFGREAEVVWFRYLQGDLEDTSEDKGVVLNADEED